MNWLKHLIDSETLDILKEYSGENVSSAIESSLLVSKLEGTEMVLLLPQHSGNDRWECWFFAHWVPGQVRYPTFRHYLEQTFQNLQTGAAAWLSHLSRGAGCGYRLARGSAAVTPRRMGGRN